MDTLLGRRCLICNAIISDDNPDGIGYSCRYAYNKAKYIIFNEDNPFELWAITVAMTIQLFITMFADTKFRSSFKKSFYPSVISQYQEKGRLSKKQLDIMETWIAEKDFNLYNDMFESIKKEKKQRVDNYTIEYIREGNNGKIERLRELTKKQYGYKADSY